jgi:GNAT superfamily N-acetyltransferase
MEVYRTLYDNEMAPVWARPHEMFHEEVAPGQKRFTPVGVLRVAAPEDAARCLACGYDTWGEGVPFDQYVADYIESKNHLRGTRYLLEDIDGGVVATLNTLRFAQGLIGIAAVAVDPAKRGQGYGSLLVRGVMELFRCEDSRVRFALFSEIDPAMYERLGFKRAPDEFQFHLPSVAMISGEALCAPGDGEIFREYF